MFVSSPKGSEVANTLRMRSIIRTPGLCTRQEFCTHLDELVPTSGDDDGVLGVGGEPDAGDPLGVALVGDGVLAVTKGVPELDGPVARAGDDLTVVGGEGDGEDVIGVADEAAGGHTGGELPQAEGLVPGRRKSVGTVRGDDLQQPMLAPIFVAVLRCSWGAFGTYAVRDDVGVALQAALGVAVSLLIAGEVPDDEGLVARTRQEHVRAVQQRISLSSSSTQNCARAQPFQTHFSREVASEVTHPLWPSRVPRSTSCSAMVSVGGGIVEVRCRWCRAPR